MKLFKDRAGFKHKKNEDRVIFSDDINQIIGRTDDLLDMKRLNERFSFSWETLKLQKPLISGAYGSSATPGGITSDGKFLYIVYQAAYSFIVKVDSITLEEVARWTSIDSGELWTGCVILGDYVYVGTNGTKPMLYKFDLYSLRYISSVEFSFTWDGVSDICTDGDYIYALNFNIDLTIDKIDTETMTVVSSYVDGGGSYPPSCICSDGYNLYVGLYDGHAPVIVIDPGSMGFITDITLVASYTQVDDIIFDGTYIVAIYSGIDLGIVRIDPITKNIIDNENSLLGLPGPWRLVFNGDRYFLGSDQTGQPIVVMTGDGSLTALQLFDTGGSGGPVFIFSLGVYLYVIYNDGTSLVYRNMFRYKEFEVPH